MMAAITTFDRSVATFARQVLQLVAIKDLHWPDPQNIILPESQLYIYKTCFNHQQNEFLSSVRYRYAVLKQLLSKIEQAIVDPDEDEVLDELMEALSELMTEGVPSEAVAAEQKSWVTYAYPVSEHENQMRLSESRSVISGSGTTGFRTWEAALHLGNYLLSSPSAKSLIADKTVLELGAGTGFLSILCAQSLNAKHVFCTDGSEEMVDLAKANVSFNQCSHDISTGVLRWGWNVKEGLLSGVIEDGMIDTVLGADVTYDTSVVPALASTIRHIFEGWPKAIVVISATIRNEETFAAFWRACKSNNFSIEEIDFPTVPSSEQSFLFYSSQVSIKIVQIRANGQVVGPLS